MNHPKYRIGQLVVYEIQGLLRQGTIVSANTDGNSEWNYEIKYNHDNSFNSNKLQEKFIIKKL